MNVVFLDIDGVMNSAESKFSDVHEDLAFDDEAVFYLKKLLNQFNAKIVLSSYWRVGENFDNFRNRIMKPYGLDGYLIDFTPIHGLNTERGYEIAEWLESNKEVKNFIIIDDNDDMVDYINRLILVDADLGFREIDYNRAVYKFKDVINYNSK